MLRVQKVHLVGSLGSAGRCQELKVALWRCNAEREGGTFVDSDLHAWRTFKILPISPGPMSTPP